MARKKIKEIPEKNGISSRLNFTESYTSLILGAIFVLVIGVLFFSFAKGNRNMQTSSVNEGPNAEEQISQDKTNTSSTYTIKPGDDLWSISEIVYKNGYKWSEIAKVNKIGNPGLIHAGNKLMIPKIENKEVAIQPNNSTQDAGKIMENNAITGTTYTVVEEDNLWDISVRAYGDGYKWVEIAKVNNLENPDLIYPNNILKLPR